MGCMGCLRYGEPIWDTESAIVLSHWGEMNLASLLLHRSGSRAAEAPRLSRKRKQSQRWMTVFVHVIGSTLATCSPIWGSFTSCQLN